MTEIDKAQLAADAIAGLGADPTPAEVLKATRVYDARSLAAAAGSSAAGAGGSPGGSQPLEVVQVPIAFDTPNLKTTGISTGYTTAVGDVVVAAIVSVVTAFDGTNPILFLYLQGDTPDGDQLSVSLNIGTGSENSQNGSGHSYTLAGAGFGQSNPNVVTAAADLRLKLTEDTESAAGEATIMLWIQKAAT